MFKKINKNRPIFSFFLLFAVGFLASTAVLRPAQAQAILPTTSSDIRYENPHDLAELARRLGGADNTLRSRFFHEPLSADFAARLAARIDVLFDRVCRLLKRRPREAERLQIFLLRDGQQVRARRLAFAPYLANRSLFSHASLEAFYETQGCSIFLSLADVRPGILVHEMTHHVLCQSSAQPPSPRLQEEWARYAEAELD